MHWVEFALQGVRGFLPSVRVSLKPGYWTLLPNTPGAPLVGLTSELCFPDGRGGDARFASAEGGATSKAALSIVGRDRTTYRILRELGRSGALHRVNPATRGHDLVTEEPTEMAQFLRAQVGFPPRGRYETLFTFTPGQLPSKRPRRSRRPRRAVRGRRASLRLRRESAHRPGPGAGTAGGAGEGDRALQRGGASCSSAPTG